MLEGSLGSLHHAPLRAKIFPRAEVVAASGGRNSAGTGSAAFLKINCPTITDERKTDDGGDDGNHAIEIVY